MSISYPLDAYRAEPPALAGPIADDMPLHNAVLNETLAQQPADTARPPGQTLSELTATSTAHLYLASVAGEHEDVDALVERIKNSDLPRIVKETCDSIGRTVKDIRDKLDRLPTGTRGKAEKTAEKLLGDLKGVSESLNELNRSAVSFAVKVIEGDKQATSKLLVSVTGSYLAVKAARTVAAFLVANVPGAVVSLLVP